MSISFDQFDRLQEWSSAQRPNLERDFESEATKRTIRKLIEERRRNPLVLEYAAKGTLPNTRPWHAVGEKLSIELHLLGFTPVAWLHGLHRGEPVLKENEPMSVGVFATLTEAQPFLWRNHAAQICRESPDLPRHVIGRHAFPYPLMFVSLETNYITRLRQSGGELECLMDSYLVVAASDFLRVFTFCTLEETNFVVRTQFTFGKTYPDDFRGDELFSLTYLLKMAAFMDGKILVETKCPIDRPQRRRMARAGVSRKVQDQLVSVVELRATETVTSGREATDFERQHHWWVRGHWRAQWYASEQAHHPKWIDAHIKGDRLKPLLEKVYDVRR